MLSSSIVSYFENDCAKPSKNIARNLSSFHDIALVLLVS